MARLGELIHPAELVRCGTGTYPVLSMTMHDGIMFQSERFKKNLASVDQSGYKVVKRGQLVVGFPIDEGVLYVQNVADEGIMSPAYGVWDVREDRIDGKFLELSLHSPRCMQYYKDKLRGTTARRRSIPTEDLLALEIDLPSLEEQRHITAVLDKASKLIALRKQQLAKLHELVIARFVEMFGDPVSNPMGWKKCRFDSLCENLDYRRKPITASERETGIYPYYGASGIVDYVADYIFDEDILLVSEDGANLLMRSTPIAFSVSGKVWVNNHAHVVKFKKMSMQKYIEVLFSLIDISDHITGSAQPKLNQAKLNSMMFPVPNEEQLDTFLQFIEQTDKSKLAVQQALDKLETLKKALMQGYFG